MSIVIPDEIVQSTRLTQAEFVQELAIALYQRLALTLGEASRLAGLNQWQFQQLLGARNIQIHYGVADFDADLKTLNELRVENNEYTSKHLSDQLANAIESSQSILELADDWDEEGSPGYEKSTWSRATNFISSIALSFRQKSGFWIDPPRILPGPEGSIDIHWKMEYRELLINIPKSSAEPADYFGYGSGQDAIKGKLDTSLHNEWILLWLTR